MYSSPIYYFKTRNKTFQISRGTFFIIFPFILFTLLLGLGVFVGVIWLAIKALLFIAGITGVPGWILITLGVISFVLFSTLTLHYGDDQQKIKVYKFLYLGFTGNLPPDGQPLPEKYDVKQE